VVDIARRKKRTKRRKPSKTTRRRPRTMAKRRRSYRRRATGNKDIIGGMIAGALAGAAQQYLGVPFADDAAILAYGMYSKNSALKVIGAVGLGNDLVNYVLPKINIGGGTGNNGILGG